MTKKIYLNNEANIKKEEVKEKVKEFKEKLKNYFKGNNYGAKFDVRLSDLFEDLNLNSKDLPLLEVCLEKLINENWIIKAKTIDWIYEYNPGQKLNFDGNNNGKKE